MNEISFEALEKVTTDNNDPNSTTPDPEAKRLFRELFTYATLDAVTVIGFVFLYINVFHLTDDLAHTLSISVMPALIVLFVFSQWKFFGVISKIDKRKHLDNATNQRMLTLTFALQTGFFGLGFLYIYFIQVLRVLE